MKGITLLTILSLSLSKPSYIFGHKYSYSLENTATTLLIPSLHSSSLLASRYSKIKLTQVCIYRTMYVSIIISVGHIFYCVHLSILRNYVFCRCLPTTNRSWVQPIIIYWQNKTPYIKGRWFDSQKGKTFFLDMIVGLFNYHST